MSAYIHAYVCVCVCKLMHACACTYVCVYMCAHVCIYKGQGQLQLLFHGWYFLCDKISHWLDWLDSEPNGSACLCLPFLDCTHITISYVESGSLKLRSLFSRQAFYKLSSHPSHIFFSYLCENYSLTISFSQKALYCLYNTNKCPRIEVP